MTNEEKNILQINSAKTGKRIYTFKGTMRRDDHISIFLYDQMIWEYGGNFSNNKYNNGYACCISDADGYPKNVVSIKKNPNENGNHALVKVTKGDYIAFGSFSLRRDIGVTAFIAVFRVINATRKTADLEKVFFSDKFIIDDDEIEKNADFRLLVKAVMTKMRMKNCKVPIFVNRWGFYNSKNSFPKIKVDFPLSNPIKKLKSFDELEKKIISEKTEHLKVLVQIFEVGDKIAVYTADKIFSISDIKENEEIDLTDVQLLENDLLSESKNPKIRFGVKTKAEFLELSSIHSNFIKLNDNVFGVIRTFK